MSKVDKDTQKAIDDTGSIDPYIWDQVFTTRSAFTKKFDNGSYKGTSTNPMYNIMRATAMWGPIGDKWGFEVASEDLIDGAPMIQQNVVIGHSKVVKILLRLWYPNDRGEQKSVEAYGGCLFYGMRSNGKLFTDDDAFKKAFTDAQSKAFSYLGFAADIFLGFYDDVKYVESQSSGESPAMEHVRKVDPKIEEKKQVVLKAINESKSVPDLEAAWKENSAWIKEMAGHADTKPIAIALQEAASTVKKKLPAPDAVAEEKDAVDAEKGKKEAMKKND